MSKKRGLGKSLDALLIGSSSVMEHTEERSTDSLKQLAVEMIQRGKYQPRRDMDPEALEGLANSIRAQGVIQPIVVRQILGGRYEIIAGERRWKAAKLAGLTEIPAIIKNIPDEAAVAIALIENIQREDLNPVEEAVALQRLIEEFSMTHQQVADAVGKSRASVTNLLRLLSLTDEVRQMLEHGDIEMGHARALLALTEDLQIEAAQMIINNGLSVRQAEELSRRLQLPKLPTMSKVVDPDVKRLQQIISGKIKLPVAINYNAKGKGRVVIKYSNLTELDSILNYFE